MAFIPVTYIETGIFSPMPDSFYKVSSDLLNLSLDAYNPNDGKSLRYPAGLSNAGIPFVLFAPYQRTRVISQSDNKISPLTQTPAPTWTIALPIPPSALSTSYQVKYRDLTLGTKMGVALGNPGLAAAGAAAAVGITGILLGKYKGVAINTAKGFAKAAGVVEQITPEGAKDAAELFTQQQLNPFTEVLFDSIPFRTHSFSYTFYPRNSSESETLDKILQRFKFYMLPRLGGRGALGSVLGSTSIDFPYEWQIYYSINNTTFTLLPSVLEDFDVDYGGQTDSVKLFAPISGKRYPSKIIVTMKFKETFVLYRNLLNVSTDINPLPRPIGTEEEKEYFFSATYRL